MQKFKAMMVAHAHAEADVVEESDISGLREQILANVEVLYPIMYTAQSEVVRGVVLPKFHLITIRKDFETSALVLIEKEATEKGRSGPEKDLLVQGPAADSVKSALEGLLNGLSVVLQKKGMVRAAFTPPLGWFPCKVEESGMMFYTRRQW
ncbi:Hypothetical predicted protein [Lecanosticta acicola]|uniref:Uncharacterized protein n=1 Tax=Lecanosticta acicola TaxID=111012 RepID=A0AAI8YTK1_9PEZI|nr:Hypothetical predicted protein [Lecanosticta acicola]